MQKAYLLHLGALELFGFYALRFSSWTSTVCCTPYRLDAKGRRHPKASNGGTTSPAAVCYELLGLILSHIFFVPLRRSLLTW